jgi:cyclopropane fatty-acyl-phospholipid synthase-like methyltransferase
MNGYFASRNIDDLDYKNYKLPKYLIDKIGRNKSVSILDIGCGLGQTLLSLKKEGYNNIKGIDISQEAVDSCREKGLDIEKIENIIKFCKKSEKKFDFIMMSHVLEHIAKDEIINTLISIKKYLMNKNAILYIAVPNAQSNANSYWAFEDFTHSTIFTSGSLIYVLKEAGFKNYEFLDKDCLSGLSIFKKITRKIFLEIYKINKNFWNKITSSSYHKKSPNIFSFQIKIIAINK